MTFFRWLKQVGPLKIAVALFCALALFILIVDKPGSASREKVEAGHPLLLPRLELDAITNVVIQDPGVPELTLHKTETGWQAGETPANPETVDLFLNGVFNLKVKALVSRNPDKQSLFGLDPAHATHIRLWKNTKILADFYVGQVTELKSQYVRIEGADDVFETIPLLPPLL